MGTKNVSRTRKSRILRSAWRFSHRLLTIPKDIAQLCADQMLLFGVAYTRLIFRLAVTWWFVLQQGLSLVHRQNATCRIFYCQLSKLQIIQHYGLHASPSLSTHDVLVLLLRNINMFSFLLIVQHHEAPIAEIQIHRVGRVELVVRIIRNIGYLSLRLSKEPSINISCTTPTQYINDKSY